MSAKKKLLITTTIPTTLFFFKEQCKILNVIYDVIAVSSSGNELKLFAEQEGIRFAMLNMSREISLFHDIVSLFKWIVLLIRERPYIVHANTPKASLLAMLASWLTFRPVRIYMCHGLRYQGCTGIKRNLLIWMERISCFCANHVICVSEGVREQLDKDRICSLSKSKVIMHGSANGVDTDFFNPDIINESHVKIKYNIKDTDLTIAFVGRMVRDKGLEELVQVVTSLHKEGKSIKLLLIGGRENNLNALSKRTEQQIRESDFIIDCGLQKDVRAFIKSAKVLVLPSYREGFGQVLIEANSLSVPVIATRIVGCKNVISEEVNGLLCEPRSIQSLYDAIVKLFDNENRYDSIKSKCRQYTIEHYDRKMVSRAYIEYYTSFWKANNKE